MSPDPHSPIPMSPDSLREFYARAEPIDLTPADPPRVPGWCLALGVGVLVVAFTAAIWRG